MDDAHLRRLISQPIHVNHRRYEAVRAVIVDRRPQKEVAGEFGFEYSSLRQLLYEVRRDSQGWQDLSPFFASRLSDGRLSSGRSPQRRRTVARKRRR